MASFAETVWKAFWFCLAVLFLTEVYEHGLRPTWRSLYWDLMAERLHDHTGAVRKDIEEFCMNYKKGLYPMMEFQLSLYCNDLLYSSKQK